MYNGRTGPWNVHLRSRDFFAAASGSPTMVIVGLQDLAVKESKDRVSTALVNAGFNFPIGKTTINLAPADIKKKGPNFDLPIAVGMLAARKQIETDQLENFVMGRKIALNGAGRQVKGGAADRVAGAGGGSGGG